MWKLAGCALKQVCIKQTVANCWWNNCYIKFIHQTPWKC